MLVLNKLRGFAVAGALVAGVALSGMAGASPLPAPTATDFTGSYDLGNAFPNHGLWFGDFFYGDSPAYAKNWSVVSGTATVLNTGGTHTLGLQGSTTHKTETGLGLDFDFNLTKITHSGSPFCQGGSACATGVANGNDNVKFFDFMTSNVSIKGTMGTALEGLKLTLSIRPSDGSKPPQLGYCANWITCDFGYSNWFGWTASLDGGKGTDEGEYLLFGDYKVKKSGYGDLNLDLLPNGGGVGGEVPLPAAAWMLLAGVGALGATRKLKRRS